MITLYLVRHGQTVENIKRIFQGQLPGQLTQEGIGQAHELHDKLLDIEFDMAVCSDLKRATDTMDIIIEGHNLSYDTTVLLREIDWGSWTGLDIKSVDLNNFPPDVESREMLYERAVKMLELLKSKYKGNVLVVGHGLINRSLQANIEGVQLNNIKSVSMMNNCEVRVFNIE